ncbi:PAS domain-containing protein [Bradyrhizobium guangxiense]
MSASSSISDPAYLRARAMETLFERLEKLCEGAIAIDRGGRVVYVNEKYLAALGLKRTSEAIGRPIEEIIPNSLMRKVVETGEPILLDIMEARRRAARRHPHADRGRERDGDRRDRLRAL